MTDTTLSETARQKLDKEYVIVDVSDVLSEIEECGLYNDFLRQQSLKSMVIPMITGSVLECPGLAPDVYSIRLSLERKIGKNMDHELFDNLSEHVCVRTEEKLEESVVYIRDPTAYYPLRWVDSRSILFQYKEEINELIDKYTGTFDDVPY